MPQNMSRIRLPAILATTVLWLAPSAVTDAVAAERPNILLVVSEDNGPELGCYGEPSVKTPVLDKFAAEGVRFERAYVPQAGCSQSRAAYLTGLYPHQNGQIGLATWHFRMYREETPNIVDSLKGAGYRTGIIGKLHVNPASAFPFDFKAIPSANFGRAKLGDYARHAEEFFDASDEPFFLSINYPDAHRPFIKQVAGLPADPIESGSVAPLRYIGLDSPQLRIDTANHYNSMARLDALVGRLLDALRRSGKADNTLVVYLGDHGADLIRGKRTCYEGGVRVPLIVRWPGSMQPGQVRTELVSTLDLMPTFLAAAGIAPTEDLPGRSLVPLIEGARRPWRRYLFSEFHLHSSHNYYPQRAVRDERYKLICNLLGGQINPGYDFTLGHFRGYGGEIEAALARAPQQVRDAYRLMRQPPEFEFYDLAADPYEFTNLADDPAHADALQRLKRELLDWRRQTDDPLLDHDNVLRLKAEIEATKQDGVYRKKESPWGYRKYMSSRAGVNRDRPASRRPNIVLILADDLGFSDVGCYGGEIDTPHIDSLATAGMRFTQFYNCARCVPTRQSLLTGLYPQQVDGTHSVTIAEVLRRAGYRTLMTGKWHGHPGLPTQHGFDRFYGLTSGSCNFFNPGSRRPGEPEPAKDFGQVRPWAIDGKRIRPYTPEDPDWYATDAFTDYVLAYLDEYADEARPFFLFLSYTAPHHPLQAPKGEIAKYRGKYDMGWDELRRHRWRRMQRLGLTDASWQLSLRDPEAPAWKDVVNKDEWDLAMAVYAAMVDRMDQNIGRVLDKIRELGEEDRTVVMFLSDNGACAEVNNQTPDVPPGPMESYRTYDVPWANAGDTPFRKFKRYTHEGGICTPLIVKWPKLVEAGSISRAPGHVIDLMPTFCELAGAAYPKRSGKTSMIPCEGKSLVPLLRGRARQPHAILCWEHIGNKAVRQGDWKLVGRGDPANLENWELYNLADDRTENHNLAAVSPQRVERMARAWQDWARRTGLKR